MRSWMLVALAVAGGLVLLVALVVAVGAALPRGHVATRSATLAADPESVFRLISDFAGATAWRADLERVEVLESANGLPRFREHGAHGAMTMEVTEWQPPRRLVVRIADAGLPFGGRWIYELGPADGGGTVLTLTEEGEVHSPIYRFVSRFVIGHHATLDRYLESLAGRLAAPGGAAAAAQP